MPFRSSWRLCRIDRYCPELLIALISLAHLEESLLCRLRHCQRSIGFHTPERAPLGPSLRGEQYDIGQQQDYDADDTFGSHTAGCISVDGLPSRDIQDRGGPPHHAGELARW